MTSRLRFRIMFLMYEKSVSTSVLQYNTFAACRDAMGRALLAFGRRLRRQRRTSPPTVASSSQSSLEEDAFDSELLSSKCATSHSSDHLERRIT